MSRSVGKGVSNTTVTSEFSSLDPQWNMVKRGLQNMVISEQWNSYREDDVRKAAHVKELILNDLWWDKVDYILSFMDPIYCMLRSCDKDVSNLHLVYEKWDSMIQSVKATIYRNEQIQTNEVSNFYNVVHRILTSRWSKSCTPLHSLGHSLNPRYYSEQWLSEAPNRVAPHLHDEVSRERNKCLKRYFPLIEERNQAYVHTNLRLLSRKNEGYIKGATKFWDISGDAHDPLEEDGVGLLELAELTLDKPDMEVMLFMDDGNEGEEIECVSIRQYFIKHDWKLCFFELF